jgi:SsrA-binding protein
MMAKPKKANGDGTKTVATNRKARHDYFVEDSYEAGLVLTGTEIKSIRAGRVNLRDSFVVIKEGELWMLNTHIAPYDRGTYANHDPRRPRKLLMHRREINRIAGKLQEKGFTLVPLRLYLKNNRAKVELGLVKGKRQYDKRATLREKETRREIDRAVARRMRGE